MMVRPASVSQSTTTSQSLCSKDRHDDDNNKMSPKTPAVARSSSSSPSSYRGGPGGAGGGFGRSYDNVYGDGDERSSRFPSILIWCGKLVYLLVLGSVRLATAAIRHPSSAIVTVILIGLPVVYVYRKYIMHDETNGGDIHADRCVSGFPECDPSQSPYVFLRKMYEWVIRFRPSPRALSRVGFGTKEQASWRALSHVIMGSSRDQLLAKEDLESCKRNAARALRIDPRVFHLTPRPTLQTMLSIQVMAGGARGREVDVIRRTLELDVGTVWDVVSSAAGHEGELLPSDLASTMLGLLPVDSSSK